VDFHPASHIPTIAAMPAEANRQSRPVARDLPLLIAWLVVVLPVAMVKHGVFVGLVEGVSLTWLIGLVLSCCQQRLVGRLPERLVRGVMLAQRDDPAALRYLIQEVPDVINFDSSVGLLVDEMLHDLDAHNAPFLNALQVAWLNRKLSVSVKSYEPGQIAVDWAGCTVLQLLNALAHVGNRSTIAVLKELMSVHRNKGFNGAIKECIVHLETRLAGDTAYLLKSTEPPLDDQLLRPEIAENAMATAEYVNRSRLESLEIVQR
jgi:hypothetical protein